jgi:DNA-binding response OmpR family regulator
MKENQTLLATEESAASPTPSGTIPPRRILVVDDDITIRRLSKAVLIHHGFQVDAAEDGAAGWDALRVNHYDLLITDNNMPKVTGVELVKKLRSADMTLPVILVSGLIPEELNRNPWLLDATLLKPFTTDELLETVNNVLRTTENPREQIHSPPLTELQPSAEASGVKRFQSVLP